VEKKQNPVIDELTGLPILSSVYKRIEEELNNKQQVGFLYFDVVQFVQLEEKYSHQKCRELLKIIGETLQMQRGHLYRDEDLVVVGGQGIDYFVLFLFSPPRRKEHFANHDLKLISTRIKQKLQNVINERSDEIGIEESIDFHTGYTVIKKDPHMQVERLIYESRKEAGFKAQLEEIMIQFISNVSHELRTPLTSIKGYTETLLEGAMSDEQLCQRWLSIILDEAQRMERLINDLLDLSMLEAEQVEMNFKQVDLKKLTTNVIEILHPLAAKEDVKLSAKFTDDFPYVIVDEDRLKQVLLNLIHNAIKYSPRGQEVCVQGKKLVREVEITITDKGCGIPQVHLNKIFEQFYRVDKNQMGKAAGRGLGLAIARHIVESHGGTIGAYSERGEGSTFYFKIPLDLIKPTEEMEMLIG
jgi:signal transduction histidine kinase